MKQKLALACTLVHEPELILLDEPTTGVDPVSRREFWKLLSEFLADGITIVMSTPYMDEAERCTRIAMLHEGRVLESGDPSRLREQMPGRRASLEDVFIARLSEERRQGVAGDREQRRQGVAGDREGSRA
jgi:ABC-2 type transport system ATP-binding protein